MSETIASLAAFDPAKLAMMLANLPSDARILELTPLGPLIARPKSKDDIAGQFVYEDTKVFVCCGDKYEQIGELASFNGKPYMTWRMREL